MKISVALLFLISLFSFCVSNSYGQEDYSKYHEQINKAEKLISTHQFQDALNTYQDIFNAFDFVFVRDYKIAAQLAVYLNDNDTAYEIIKEGIASGFDVKGLRRKDYLFKLKKESQWELIEREYPELRKRFLNRIDHSTREEVHEMFKKDQKKALGALLRIGEPAQQRYASRKFAPHSEVQLQKLIEILEDKGYPGERLIGNSYWVSTILSHHNSITTAYANKDTLYKYIKPKLFEAIKKGQMSPYEFVLIDDWYITVSSDRTQTGYGFLNSPLNSTLEETNKLRERVGLRTVQLRNKLVDIEKETGMNFYLPDWIKGKIKVEER